MNENALHAHVAIESRDCDGRYDRTHVSMAVPGEDFFATMMYLYGPGEDYDAEHGDYTETFPSGNFNCYQRTEEGFTYAEVKFCTDDDTDERGTFRDYTAESMGY